MPTLLGFDLSACAFWVGGVTGGVQWKYIHFALVRVGSLTFGSVRRLDSWPKAAAASLLSGPLQKTLLSRPPQAAVQVPRTPKRGPRRLKGPKKGGRRKATRRPRARLRALSVTNVPPDNGRPTKLNVASSSASFACGHFSPSGTSLVASWWVDSIISLQLTLIQTRFIKPTNQSKSINRPAAGRECEPARPLMRLDAASLTSPSLSSATHTDDPIRSSPTATAQGMCPPPVHSTRRPHSI